VWADERTGGPAGESYRTGWPSLFRIEKEVIQTNKLIKIKLKQLDITELEKAGWKITPASPIPIRPLTDSWKTATFHTRWDCYAGYLTKDKSCNGCYIDPCPRCWGIDVYKKT